jgi:hypothetical protein
VILALPNGRKMLSNKFDSIYKPSLVKVVIVGLLIVECNLITLSKRKAFLLKQRDFTL